MSYQTISVQFADPACTIRLGAMDAEQVTIDQKMIEELHQALDTCEGRTSIVVLEGQPKSFCVGADFNALTQHDANAVVDPSALYELWNRLAWGSFVSVAHVRGKTSAGGMGFVAACDIALAEAAAEFSLSELLFDLFPACVLPFVIRRMGTQKAHYLTLSTKPVNAATALSWGLLDAMEVDSASLLRKHLLRLRHLSIKGITHYKSYLRKLDSLLDQAAPQAIAANQALFADPENLSKIRRYMTAGQFPWET